MSKSVIPSGPDIVSQALLVIGGAVLAAFILSKLPQVRAYIRQNAASPGGVPPVGCDCGK